MMKPREACENAAALHYAVIQTFVPESPERKAILERLEELSQWTSNILDGRRQIGRAPRTIPLEAGALPRA